ncbi:hypothetical protein M501DRAFT_994823 [Patellaria atrata CBS 101060]|uniref:Uncharacterized protein n=1 Tax=Patellaria atrata CBS 101060 TaxID=1346257 RepID=A0A9P4SJK8_9PEZI|nr:hypothetical protein M501DRAFT_994823 [Patellaria atrata CBS 101060]
MYMSEDHDMSGAKAKGSPSDTNIGTNSSSETSMETSKGSPNDTIAEEDMSKKDMNVGEDLGMSYINTHEPIFTAAGAPHSLSRPHIEETAILPARTFVQPGPSSTKVPISPEKVHVPPEQIPIPAVDPSVPLEKLEEGDLKSAETFTLGRHYRISTRSVSCQGRITILLRGRCHTSSSRLYLQHWLLKCLTNWTIHPEICKDVIPTSARRLVFA